MKTVKKTKKKDKPQYSVTNNVIFLLREIKKTHPMLLVFMGLQCVFSVLGPVLGIYLPKVAVGLAAEKADIPEILAKLGGMGLLLFLSMALTGMAEEGKYTMQNSMRYEYHKQLFLCSLSCEYSQIESVEGQRKYGRARNSLFQGDGSGTTVMAYGAVDLVINVALFAIYGGIISTLNLGVILLLTGLSLVSLIAVRHANAYEFQHKDEEAGLSNKLDYVEWTANDIQFGKDIRLYGMEHWFLEMRGRIMETYTALNRKIKNRYFGAGVVNGATLLVRDGIAYTYLIESVASGKITVGDFVLYFGAVTGFSDFVGKITDSINDLHKSNLHMNDMRAFLDVAKEPERAQAAETSPTWLKEYQAVPKQMQATEVSPVWLPKNQPMPKQTQTAETNSTWPPGNQATPKQTQTAETNSTWLPGNQATPKQAQATETNSTWLPENQATPKQAQAAETNSTWLPRNQATPKQAQAAETSKGHGLQIDFENVTFAYEKDAEPVLKDFTLHIRSGEKTALVGVNGAGKSTVVKLLCGFYQPDSGRILINGTDIRLFPREDLFSLFSTVFQDIYLPPFTIAENVSMAAEKDTDMDRVTQCLKDAGLYGKISEYPDSIHSYMGKAIYDGIVLSGGQQQKLLMARALYKDAPILILDEPTAALDPLAESETYENFHSFSKDKTAIYISHRLASTRFCDRIVLLSHGRIEEEGTHEALVEKGREYAKMYEIQSQYYQDGLSTPSGQKPNL